MAYMLSTVPLHEQKRPLHGTFFACAGTSVQPHLNRVFLLTAARNRQIKTQTKDDRMIAGQLARQVM